MSSRCWGAESTQRESADWLWAAGVSPTPLHCAKYWEDEGREGLGCVGGCTGAV